MRYLIQPVRDFLDDDCQTMAAALAYYTVFSLPPLLVILISVAGFVFGAQTVETAIRQQVSGLIGQGAADQVGTMAQHAGQKTSAGLIGAVIGTAALLLGATTAFAQIQASLNRVWGVKPDPNQGGVWSFISKRVLSFGMILAVAFLLLVSLAISTALSAVGSRAQAMLPGLSEQMFWALNAGFSLVVITILFAAMFKILPDTEVRWRDVWFGALVTALLFTTGKFGLGFYLGRSDAAGGYGTAGSVVLILLWTYYAAMILLLGAEFTQVWANARGGGIRPQRGAVKVIREERVA
jgi:membrane protein